MEEQDKNFIERAMWLTYFNEYLFGVGYITLDEKQAMEYRIDHPDYDTYE